MISRRFIFSNIFLYSSFVGVSLLKFLQVFYIIVLCPYVGAYSIWHNFRNQWWIWRQHKSLQQRCESGGQRKLSSSFCSLRLQKLIVPYPATNSHDSSITTAGCWNNDRPSYFTHHLQIIHHHLRAWHIYHATHQRFWTLKSLFSWKRQANPCHIVLFSEIMLSYVIFCYL